MPQKRRPPDRPMLMLGEFGGGSRGGMRALVRAPYVRMGGLEMPKDLFARYPAGTLFSLSVGPVPCISSRA